MDSFFTSVDFVSKWGAALFGLSVASFLRPLKWLLGRSQALLLNHLTSPKISTKNTFLSFSLCFVALYLGKTHFNPTSKLFKLFYFFRFEKDTIDRKLATFHGLIQRKNLLAQLNDSLSVTRGTAFLSFPLYHLNFPND